MITIEGSNDKELWALIQEIEDNEIYIPKYPLIYNFVRYRKGKKIICIFAREIKNVGLENV